MADDAYSSTYTVAAVPEETGDPEPTRTTARLNALKVGEGVVVEVCEGVCIDVWEDVCDDVCDEVCVDEQVCDEVCVADDVEVLVGDAVPVEQEPAKTGAIEKGADVTPRNTVFAGAVARTVATSLSILYEYSVVAEVRYNWNAPQISARPAMEMIMAPDSSSMAAVGVCRVHVVPDPVYCAMLLVARLAVSVIQMESVEVYTNP